MRSILIWAPIDTSGSYKGAACKGAHILHCSALKAFNAQYCVGAEVLAGRPRRVGGAPAGDIHGREADPPHTTRPDCDLRQYRLQSALSYITAVLTELADARSDAPLYLSAHH